MKQNIRNILETKSNKTSKLDTKTSRLDPRSEKLDPKTERCFRVFNNETYTSKRSLKEFKSDKFTNFLSKKQVSEFKGNIYKYVKNWDLLRKEKLDQDFDEDERLKRIFQLYLNEEDYDFHSISKVRIKTLLTQSTGLRIYIILKDNMYQVFLIDPLHLVIPSKYQAKNNVYETNKGNGMCMSTIINQILSN